MPPIIPPAGISLAGFFVPQTFASSGPPGIIAWAKDPATGEFLSISKGFDPTDAAVLAAISIVRDSGSAVLDIGQKYNEIERVDDQAVSQLIGQTRTALERLELSGQIQIKSITVDAEPTNDWAEVTLTYFNRRRRQERTLPFKSKRIRINGH